MNLFISGDTTQPGYLLTLSFPVSLLMSVAALHDAMMA